MLYDIFDKSMMLDFIGKVLKIVGNEQFVLVSNSISYDFENYKSDKLTEISAILYIFLLEKLPICIRYMQQTGKETNELLEELKMLIDECKKKEKKVVGI